MKKGIFVLGVVLLLVVCFAVVSMAYPNKDAGVDGTKENVKRACPKMGMGPMAGMMPCMMAKSMVATSDGGVIILIGNRLLKYDKNLNLVKEVKIEMEPTRMEEGMPGMPRMSHAAPQASAQGFAQDTKK